MLHYSKNVYKILIRKKYYIAKKIYTDSLWIRLSELIRGNVEWTQKCCSPVTQQSYTGKANNKGTEVPFDNKLNN